MEAILDPESEENDNKEAKNETIESDKSHLTEDEEP
jgi:hypothetical protein